VQGLFLIVLELCGISKRCFIIPKINPVNILISWLLYNHCILYFLELDIIFLVGIVRYPKPCSLPDTHHLLSLLHPSYNLGIFDLLQSSYLSELPSYFSYRLIILEFLSTPHST
jgi:hypothetical protein